MLAVNSASILSVYGHYNNFVLFRNLKKNVKSLMTLVKLGLFNCYFVLNVLMLCSFCIDNSSTAASPENVQNPATVPQAPTVTKDTNIKAESVTESGDAKRQTIHINTSKKVQCFYVLLFKCGSYFERLYNTGKFHTPLSMQKCVCLA